MEVGHARRGEKSATPIITGPANMSNQRLVILAVGVLLVMGGLFALRFPVFLGDFDQWGVQINCGSGFQSALTQAGIADSAGTHFVDRSSRAAAAILDTTERVHQAGTPQRLPWADPRM